MNLAIDAQRLGQVRDLHRPGDAHVVFGVRTQEIRTARDHEIRFRLDAPDMLGLKDRRRDLLPQDTMRVRTCAGIPERILVPHVPRLVAGPAHIDRVRKGAQLASTVQHQVHSVACGLPHMKHVLRLLTPVALVPAVDLERAVAHLPALHREVAKRLLAIQTAISVAMIGRGIGRQALPIPPKHLGNRSSVFLARQVPKRDVDRSVTHVVVLSQLALHVVVKTLARLGIPPDQTRRQHQRLAQRRARAHVMRHVFAPATVSGLDHDRIARHGGMLARRVFDRAARRAAAMRRIGAFRHTKVLHVEIEFHDFDARYDGFAHWPSLPCRE